MNEELTETPTGGPAQPPQGGQQPQGGGNIDITAQDIQILANVFSAENMPSIVKMFNAVLAGSVQAVRQAASQAQGQPQGQPPAGPAPDQAGTPPTGRPSPDMTGLQG